MNHFLAIEHHTPDQLNQLIDLAMTLKPNRYQPLLHNKTLASMFFNPSLRTKTSFDLAMHELGGHNIVLEPGKSSWGIEFLEGVVMDGDAEEHLKEAINVLARYVDCIAVRCFPPFKNWAEERLDPVLTSIAKWSSKPVVNMETISHPCQALAMAMTLKEKIGNLKNKKCVISWTYHPKPLNTAVANSAGVMAVAMGMDLVVVNPEGYDLDPYYLDHMKRLSQETGGSFTQSHNQGDAMQDADFVYIKSWGALEQIGNFNAARHSQLKDWIMTSEKMARTNGALFSHCLPLRRNIKATDEVVDAPYSIIYDEAENRLHVQKAVLVNLLKSL